MVAIQLETLKTEIWGWLGSAADDRDDPFRTPAVATAGLDGTPQARIVVLREVEAAEWSLDFYTDIRSPKCEELMKSQAATWLFYDATRQIQIRALSTASMHTSDAVADRAWAWSALASRAIYASASSPGAAIDAPMPSVFLHDDTEAEHGRRNFCVVRCRVHEFDVLQLHPGRHRRACVRPDGAQWWMP
ncbi:MAG: pyridoxamine 5'-phosphate oxidase family protein [Nannocystales bacterium]